MANEKHGQPFQRAATNQEPGTHEPEPEPTNFETGPPARPAARRLPTAEVKRMWQQFREYTELTEEHRVLAGMAGRWRVLVDFDMLGYGPNFAAKGTASGHSLFGGRFVQLQIRARSAMGTYTALVNYGFDNVTGHTFCTMMESMQNGTMVTEGFWDGENRCFREWGEFSNPMFRKRHEVGCTWSLPSPQAMTFEMQVPDGEGRLITSMVAEFRR